MTDFESLREIELKTLAMRAKELSFMLDGLNAVKIYRAEANGNIATLRELVATMEGKL